MADDEPQPDAQFGEALRAMYRADLRVPSRVDDAVMNRARAHFARNRRGSRSLVLRIGALVTSAAAIIAIGIFLAKPQAENRAPTVARVPDVKTQGEVDITDALRVAQNIRAGTSDPKRDDFNHDGSVDQGDIDAIAMAAVRQGGPQ